MREDKKAEAEIGNPRTSYRPVRLPLQKSLIATDWQRTFQSGGGRPHSKTPPRRFGRGFIER